MLGPATASSLGRARIWALVFTGQQYREMQTPITRYSVFKNISLKHKGRKFRVIVIAK